MKNQAFWRRLAFAVVGIRATIRSEASFRAQLFLGLAAAVLLASIAAVIIGGLTVAVGLGWLQ